MKDTHRNLIYIGDQSEESKCKRTHGHDSAKYIQVQIQILGNVTVYLIDPKNKDSIPILTIFNYFYITTDSIPPIGCT